MRVRLCVCVTRPLISHGDGGGGGVMSWIAIVYTSAMATRVWESTVIDASIDVVWSVRIDITT